MDAPQTRVLDGRIALITGAGRGIGREIALAYASEGADLVLLARTQSEIDRVAAEVASLGSRVLSVCADIRREEDVRMVVGRSLDAFGRIDVLVNNAGITPGAAGRPIRDMRDVSTEFWDLTFEVNCRGPFLMIRAVVPAMIGQGGGTIIGITSRLSGAPVAGNVPYGPSKAALELLTLITDSEFGSLGIRANLLHPGGPVTTGIFNEFYQPHSASDLRPPDVIRGAAVWLACDESAGVHGEVIDARTWNAERASTT